VAGTACNGAVDERRAGVLDDSGQLREERPMSVLDQLRSIEQQVLARLRELRPLVAEYRDLEKVADRLGLNGEDDEPAGTEASTAARAPKAKPAARRAAAGRSKRAPARKRKPAPAARAAAKPKPKAGGASTGSAPSTPARGRAAKANATARKRSAVAPGQREQDVLRLVGERPDITVRELAAELGVDATGLYGVVRRLQGRGQLAKDGTKLRLADTSRPAAESAATGTPAAPSETPSAAEATSTGEAGAPTAQPPVVES
jgi:hypothetical protein